MNRKWLIILMILASCRKESDELVPKISIHSPVENNSLQVPATLSVKGYVEDNHKIEYITIDLTTSNGTHLVPGKSVNISSNPQDFEVYFDLTDLHLETGEYYVKVKAGDGTSAASRFVKIKIYGAARKLDKVLIATSSSANITEVHQYDTVVNSFGIYATDFRDFDVNSRYRQLMISGEQTGPLSVINFDSKSQVFSVPSQSTSYSFFQYTRYSKSDQLLSVKGNGQVHSYSDYGSITNGMNTGLYLPLCIDEYNDKFCLGYKNVSTGQNYYAMYYKISGILYYSIPLNITPGYISGTNADQIIIMGDNSFSGLIRIFDPVTEQLSATVNLPGFVTDAEEIGGNKWLIACADDIVVYDHQLSVVSLIVAGVNSKDIAYDDLSGEIFSAEGNFLKTYSIQNGMLLNSITFANPVVGVDLLYNK